MIPDIWAAPLARGGCQDCRDITRDHYPGHACLDCDAAADHADLLRSDEQ